MTAATLVSELTASVPSQLAEHPPPDRMKASSKAFSPVAAITAGSAGAVESSVICPNQAWDKAQIRLRSDSAVRSALLRRRPQRVATALQDRFACPADDLVERERAGPEDRDHQESP